MYSLEPLSLLSEYGHHCQYRSSGESPPASRFRGNAGFDERALMNELS